MRANIGLLLVNAAVFVGLISFCSSRASAALVVSADPTTHVVCTPSGTCSPTETDAVLNIEDVKEILKHSNLILHSSGSNGVDANDISFDSRLAWADGHTLTIIASGNIYINKHVTVAGAHAGVTLSTSSGDLVFGKNGRLSFSSLRSNLSINETNYTLTSGERLNLDLNNHGNGDYALADSYALASSKYSLRLSLRTRSRESLMDWEIRWWGCISKITPMML